MSVLLTLYKTISSNNTINKVLTDPMNLHINLKRDFDISNPSILLNIEGDIKGFNYASIPDLNRLYFISKQTQMNKTLVRIDLEVDLLETYKSDILANSAVVRKKIDVGDYGGVQLTYTGEEEITHHYSDIEIDQADSAILSIVRWG